jgi:flagellar biosynthesis/type III secretory pathway M-ring protein FliF/YscJ
MVIPLSAFKIGIVLVVIGSMWTGIIFSNTIKESKNVILDRLDSARIPVDLNGNGLGFYVISTNSYDNVLLAKILDSQGNYMEMKRITNKLTVNYFEFDKTGEVMLEITNFADKPVELTMEIGDTRFQDFVIPAIIVFFGTCLLVFAGYKKLRAYITAQPDENI